LVVINGRSKVHEEDDLMPKLCISWYILVIFVSSNIIFGMF